MKKNNAKNNQQRRLQASNAAHKALQNCAIKRGDEHKQLYHGACIYQQETSGRVFTRAERKKVYDNVRKNIW